MTAFSKSPQEPLQGTEFPEYRVATLLLLALVAAAVRLFLEWALGGAYSLFPLSDLTMSAAFFWLAFLLLAGVLHVLVRRPWRETIRWAVPIACLGVLPPVIDALWGGPGFQYGYLWNFPEGYVWYFHAPAFHITLGETVAWWSIIALVTLYVAARTRSLLKTLAAPLLTYGVGWALLAGVPTLAESLRGSMDWPLHHRRTVFNLTQILVAFCVYGLLQPALMRGLLRRVHHAFPFVMVSMVGAAFAGGITSSTLVYAGLLLLVFVAALGQNDYFDTVEDSLQGRGRYLDIEDVHFLTITVGFVLATLAAVGTMAAVPLLVVLVVSMLYSYPFYRGKRYFPSNLKMEGMWGLSSFTLGIVGAIEHAAYGAPRWWLALRPEPVEAHILQAFDGVTLTAMLLVFGGYSFVAVLKDYKDWEADGASGITTVYTLAARRGWSLRRVHGIALTGSAVSLAAAPVLLALAGMVAWVYSVGGLIVAGLLWRLLYAEPSAPRFKGTLFLLTAYFLFLVLALSFPYPLAEANG